MTELVTNTPPYPLLLRRLPAVIAVGVSIALGVLQLVVSAHINHKHAWGAGVLVNTGSTTLLFSPLLLLTALFGRRIVRSQQNSAERIAEVATEVVEVRRDVRAALADLTNQTLSRIVADRVGDVESITTVGSAPNATSVADALRLGRRLGFISHRGPRVRIRDSDTFAKWQETSDDNAVEVTIELFDGSPLRSLEWRIEEPPDELLHRIAAALRDTDHYPGDIAFDPGRIFADLRDLLEIGYKAETGAGGVRDPLGPIVQLTGDTWVLTDFCITRRPPEMQYQITLDRLGEINWDSHLRDRNGIDIAGFREAYDLANDLIDRGEPALVEAIQRLKSLDA